MNKLAKEFLSDLQQSITNLIEEYESKLEQIDSENFKDDIGESVLNRLDEVRYEIDTIMNDVEDGYYNSDIEDGFDENNDEDDNLF